MEQIFNNYFNIILRNHLKYPETFNIEILDDRIVLTPNISSQLLQKIKDNPDIRFQLIKMVQNTLSKYFSNMKEIYITSNGTNISFRIEYESRYNLSQLPDIGIYANITSNLNLKSLNDICKTNSNFVNMCKDNNFWYQMMRIRFPQYTIEPKEKINWEHVYKGFLFFEQRQNMIETVKENSVEKLTIPSFGIDPKLLLIILENDEEFFKFINKKYHGFIYYIVKYNIIKLTDLHIKYIISTLCDTTLARYLLNYYNTPPKNLINMFENALINNNVEILKFYFEYLNTLDYDINLYKDKIISMLGKIKRYYPGSILPKTFDIIDNIMNFEYNNYVDFLLKLNDYSEYNEDLIEYLLDKMRSSIIKDPSLITKTLVYLISHGYKAPISYVYEKFRYLINNEDLKLLRYEADKYYYSCDDEEDESIHDIFGWDVPNKED